MSIQQSCAFIYTIYKYKYLNIYIYIHIYIYKFLYALALNLICTNIWGESCKAARNKKAKAKALKEKRDAEQQSMDSATYTKEGHIYQLALRDILCSQSNER